VEIDQLNRRAGQSRNGSETVSDMMTADEYERLAPEEKEHFAMCVKCGEMFDRRSLDEVL
jgi:hypothetical protein